MQEEMELAEAGAFDFILDLIITFCKGYWFAAFFRGIPVRRGPAGRKNPAAFFVLLQYALVRMLFLWLPGLKRIIYGNNPAVRDLRYSIGLQFLYFGISFLVLCLLYRETLRMLLYLSVTFYALEELIRFTLFAVSDSLSTSFWSILTGALENQMVSPEWFLFASQMFARVWGVSLDLLLLLALGCLSGLFLREFYKRETRPDRQELNFLMLPGLIGIGISVIVRGTVYRSNGPEIYSLLQHNPELRIVIPLIACLCIASILRSQTVLRRLKEACAERATLQIYRQRAEDMEEHIQDLEHLYDGIRGVRHDLKNYAADMEQLLKESDISQAKTREELREYLDGLYHSMEELDFQYATGNGVTDVVVNRYFLEARKKGIETECEFIYPQGMGINAFDLSVLLNNALCNALEACEKETQEKRLIRLSGEQRGNFLILQVVNTFTKILKPRPPGAGGGEAGRAGLPASTKAEAAEHGIGMKNMLKIANKYNGTMQWEVRDGRFWLFVMLQQTGS